MPSKNVVNDDGKEEIENVDDDPAAKFDASVLAAAVTDSAVMALVEVDTAFSSPSRHRPKPRYS
jgi:hypothetical protein